MASHRELFRLMPTAPVQPPEEVGGPKQSKNAAVSCRYNALGSMLAVACADKKCVIYSATTGALLTTLANAGGHALGLNDCAWLGGSDRLVATASDDKSVKVWDIEAGKVVTSCSGHKSFVYSLDVHPDTRLLYTGGYDGSIRVFHAASGSCVMNYSGHAGAVVSLHVSPKDHQEFVTGSHDGVCRVWDAALPSCCKRSTFSDSVPAISSARYSPNGDFILVSTLDGHISLYPSQASAAPPRVSGDAHNTGAGAVKRYAGHINSRFSLQAAFFSGLPGAGAGVSDQQLLLQGSEDGQLCVWDVDSMEMLQQCSGAHSDAVLAVATNPDAVQRQVATAGRDGRVQFWSHVSV